MIRPRCTFVMLIAAALVAPSASADPPATSQLRADGDQVACTIRAIHGRQEAGGIDKRLASLRSQLSKPPFSAYKSLKLLSAKKLKIAQSAQATTKLPTGKILKLQYKEKLLAKDKVRLRLHLSITPPKAKAFLPGTVYTIANGGTLLVAGDKHQNGTLVVGVTCMAQ